MGKPDQSRAASEDPYFGKLMLRLKAARKEAGISQEMLADRIGRTQSHISKVEKGDLYITITEFVRWTKAIGIDPVAEFGQYVEMVPQRRRVPKSMQELPSRKVRR